MLPARVTSIPPGCTSPPINNTYKRIVILSEHSESKDLSSAHALDSLFDRLAAYWLLATDYWLLTLDSLDQLLAFCPDVTSSDHTNLDLYRPLLEAAKTQEQRHDLERLILLGERINEPCSLPLQYAAIAQLLRIRTKSGVLAPLHPNRVQESFSSAPGSRHIVLKARQLGMTTWIAATFFLFTITRPGTMTVLVTR